MGENAQAENQVFWKEMRAAKLVDLMNHLVVGDLAGYNRDFAKMVKTDVRNPWRGSCQRLFYHLQIKNQTVAALLSNRFKSFACAGRYAAFGFDARQEHVQCVLDNRRSLGNKDLPAHLLHHQRFTLNTSFPPR